jgi:hypothetical protein
VHGGNGRVALVYAIDEHDNSYVVPADYEPAAAEPIRKAAAIPVGDAEAPSPPSSKAAGTDRTSRKHLQRIDSDRAAATCWKAQQRAIAAIPDTVNRLIKTTAYLHKQAKGLK